ncbi:hypothetical protein QCE63_17910 [Caballeronia sp. LZ065]|uniref:hypothetical protein n=1 Tax=Caballeronia sp. LZ065 TaxID=3038571 RepID=UPI002855B0E1|nr:hypothetical protein [Caballeronia sp. LZ065]MDR5781279.1 hypothetical protein [Caballeronia sp. LZ065]
MLTTDVNARLAGVNPRPIAWFQAATKKAPRTRATAQIVFLESQPKILGSRKTHPPASLIRSAVVLARIGKLSGLSMLASVVPAGTDEPKLVPKLAGVTLLTRTMAPFFADERIANVIARTKRGSRSPSGLLRRGGAWICSARSRRIESIGASIASTVTRDAFTTMNLTGPKGIEQLTILPTHHDPSRASPAMRQDAGTCLSRRLPIRSLVLPVTEQKIRIA